MNVFTKPYDLKRAIAGLAFLPLLATAAAARGSYTGHEACAAYHLTSLPPEIKAGVMRYQSACGVSLAATHAFAVIRRSVGDTFLALHFEGLWCPAPQVVCRGDACLHEVYVQCHGRYRLVHRAYVRDIRLTDSERGLELHVDSVNAAAETLRWNGRRFLAAQYREFRLGLTDHPPAAAICDPSHFGMRRERVEVMSMAARDF